MQDDFQGDSGTATSTTLVPKPEVVRRFWRDCCAEFKVRTASDFGKGHTYLARLKLNTLPSGQLLARSPDYGCWAQLQPSVDTKIHHDSCFAGYVQDGSWLSGGSSVRGLFYSAPSVRPLTLDPLKRTMRKFLMPPIKPLQLPRAWNYSNYSLLPLSPDACVWHSANPPPPPLYHPTPRF